MSPAKRNAATLGKASKPERVASGLALAREQSVQDFAGHARGEARQLAEPKLGAKLFGVFASEPVGGLRNVHVDPLALPSQSATLNVAGRPGADGSPDAAFVKLYETLQETEPAL